jgi:hypothetical protein
MSERVNHPAHYGGANNPHEVIKIVEAWRLNFCMGNALKYVARAGKKESPTLSTIAKTIEDLSKALWYLDRQEHGLLAQLPCAWVATPFFVPPSYELPVVQDALVLHPSVAPVLTACRRQTDIVEVKTARIMLRRYIGTLA